MKIGSWLVTGQYWSIIDRVTGSREETAPYVCPGCYAVNEPCARDCIDAEIEREHRDSIERGDYDPMVDDE